MNIWSDNLGVRPGCHTRDQLREWCWYTPSYKELRNVYNIVQEGKHDAVSHGMISIVCEDDDENSIKPFLLVWRRDRRCTSIDEYHADIVSHHRYETPEMAWEAIPEEMKNYRIHIPYIRKNKRDTQKKRVYAWENTILATDTQRVRYTAAEAVELTQEIGKQMSCWRDHNECKITNNRTRSDAHQFRGIRLSRYMMYNDVIIHELAHMFTMAHIGDRDTVADHGPEFVGVYIWMLDFFTEWKRDSLMEQCDSRKIKYKMPTDDWMLGIMIDE